MADLIWERSPQNSIPDRFKQLFGKENILPLTEQLSLFGIEKTYSINKANGDFIAAIGACYFPGKTITDSLKDIIKLKIVDQKTIAKLKTELAGQYILIIKKDHQLYFFSDNWQVKQLFYSHDLNIISSSFSVLEERLGTNSSFLNEYKIFEYLAVQYIFYYPSWINNSTLHKEILFLRPFQYIEIDTISGKVDINSIQFQLDNRINNQINQLAGQFLENLKGTIENPGFQNQPVGLTLTGGYDSRLISAIAAPFYKNSELRVGISPEIKFSQTDSDIAEKVAAKLNRPLKKLSTDENSKKTFELFTEGMSPIQNFVITPIIENSETYEVGFGGIFGTELFKPIPPYSSVPEFIKKRIAHSKNFIKANESFWQQLEEAINEEINAIQAHYILAEQNLNDHIHILHLINTGFFGSFMLSSYNINSMQVEPYGHFNILNLVLKLPPHYKTTSLLMNGGALQKIALSKINIPVGKIITTHKRPMLPISENTLPQYLYRYFLDKIRIYFHIFKNHFSLLFPERKQSVFQNIYNNISHISNGTEVLFLKRIKEKYLQDS